jgi:hypothetical protein
MLALELIELAGERGVGGEESPQADEGAARCAVSLALIWVSKAPRTRIRCEPPRGFRDSLVVGVLLEGTCICNFKGISRRNWRFRSTIEKPNALFSINLRCLEYASSNQGVRGSNPFGRTFFQDLDAEFFSAVLLTKLNSTNFPHPTRVARLSTI